VETLLDMRKEQMVMTALLSRRELRPPRPTGRAKLPLMLHRTHFE
jgi:hypothetical protein